MFNSYYSSQSNYQSQSIRINAVTGAILKNHPKSWFERFNLTSERAKQLFKEGGHEATKEKVEYYDTRIHRSNIRVPEKDITILQMVICGDMEVMAELVYTKDYEMKTETDNGTDNTEE